MRRIISCFIFLLSVTTALGSSFGQESQRELPKLIVFYSPTCLRCIEAKKEIIPNIERKFKNLIEIEYRDISDIENYKLMLKFEEKYKAKIKNTLPVFYFEGRFLDGGGQIQKDLESFIARSLKNRAAEKQDLEEIDLVSRFRGFVPLTIISAGLIDGINPCAFTIIVFFISFLALQGYRKRDLIIIGLSFIFAVFIAYILIGLGIFNFLYAVKGFWLIVKTVNISIGVFSIVLGVLALYDFFKFKKSRQAEGLILQLPKVIKDRIHKIIGLHYRKQGKVMGGAPQLIITALSCGFLVSVLEAVCTGQTYLPTITFVLKTTNLKLEALGYLLLYNFMFIAPLLTIFVFALYGTTHLEFSEFLKKNMLFIKMLMAVLFFALGIFLIWRP